MIYSRLVFAALLYLLPVSLQAVERHAFIVGNSEYGGEMSLDNPVNDATDMAAELKKLGYKIFSGGAQYDLKRVELEKQLSRFALQLPPDAVALVYYAGHGVATERDNYLLPVGIDIEFQSQLPDRAVSLRSVVDLLNRSNENGFNIILLDACRDNPLKTRGVSKGLKTFGSVPRGTFIGYAAAEGQAAVDGQGRRNGVYTGELIKALQTQSMRPIEYVHKEVSRRVLNITNNEQFPVYDLRFVGDYCFGTCIDAPVTTATATTTATTLATTVPTEPPEARPNNHTGRYILLGVAAVAVLALAASKGSSPEPNMVPLTIGLTEP